MSKSHWSIYALILSFVSQTVLNLWWVSYPNKISSYWFVAGNILFGTTWVCALSVWVLRLIKVRKPDEVVGLGVRVGRPLISLVASVLLANVIGFWLCNFRLCASLLYLNVVVPVAWIVARKVLQNHVRQPSGQP
jgi:hypothetical protein